VIALRRTDEFAGWLNALQDLRAKAII